MTNSAHVKLATEIVENNENLVELATNSLVALYKISNNHYIADKDFLTNYKKLHNIIEKVDNEKVEAKK